MLLLLASCSGDDGTETMVVSVAKSNVSASAGSHLVSITCSTSWQLALTYSSEDEDWASLSTTSGSGSTGSVVLSYEANEVASPRTLTIVLSSRKGETSCTFTQEAGTVSNDDTDEDGGDGEGEDGGDDEDGGEGDEETEFVAPAWLELPALDDDNLTFYTHSQTIGSTVTRNYSFYWDKENHVSHWVAYPLNAWTIGSGSRTNAWGFDPLVPEDEQPDIVQGSFSGSYQRGHQIPSADRLSYAANVESFYATNMTPQLGALNENIWANFEASVRNWAKKSSDTLYVVTGCVVEGSTTYATDSRKDSPMSVTVPVAYYKALLRYTKASTIGYSGYIGAAFYLEHRSYSESNVTASMSMSIDDLEEKLGIDFFVNLPDLIGETAAANVEKQQPSTVSWWGLSD